MKRKLTTLLALLIALGAIALADARPLPSLTVTEALSQGATLEGPGYDTPEEAVQAYLRAFNDADVKGMVSTFAIETWAERLDTWSMTERLRAYLPTAYLRQIPDAGDYLPNLRIAWRYGDLLYSLAWQYVYYPALSYIEQNSPSGSIDVREESDLEAFYDMWASAPSAGWAGHVEFLGWIDPDALTGGRYSLQTNLRTAALQTGMYNCEDTVELISHLRLNGEEALLFMVCGRYGGRWYNLVLGNTASAIFGVPAACQALVMEGTELWQELAGGLSSAGDYGGKALIKVNLSSPLTGTRWTLTAIDGDGSNPEIVSSRRATEEHTGESAWGQLRFTRNAFIATVSRSPAQTEALFGDNAWTTAAGVWMAMGNGAVLYDKQHEDIPAQFPGDRILLTDTATGLTYTFEPAPGLAPAGAQGSGAAQAFRLESGGYGSPEEAVRAYIDAFNAGDAFAMLSTFAIETWAERANAKVLPKRAKIVNSSYILNEIPLSGEYSLQARIAGRYGTLANRLATQYLTCGGPEEYTSENLYKITDPEALELFQNQWRNAPGSRWAGNIRFLECLDPDRLMEGLTEKPTYQKAIAIAAELNGCDEVTPMIAHITIDGQDAALMFNCCRYGERWYNLEPGGTAASFLAPETNRAGLAIMGRE